jgi:predicted nucleic acid-binding Zn ribbon protein
MTEEALTVCPKDRCPQKRWGRGQVKRVLSGGAGFLLKGSGFHATDYRSEGYKQAAKKESEAASPKKDAKEGTKTETKPAASKTLTD